MKTIIFILTILLFACEQSAERTNPTLKTEFPIPYVLDSSAFTGKTYNTSEMQVPINSIIYLGAYSDTINLSKYDRRNYSMYLDIEEFGDRSIVKHGLNLYISNRQLLTIDLEDFSIPPPPIEGNHDFDFDSVATAESFNKWKERARNHIQAIPIFIYNPSKDTVYLDFQDGSVIMIQEAKDENGVWKPIEYWRYSWCGNSYGAEGLLPNTLMVVKVFKYDGDFETEIRLKLKNGDNTFYSDSYEGTINKSQFELPADIKEKHFLGRVDDEGFIDRLFLNK